MAKLLFHTCVCLNSPSSHHGAAPLEAAKVELHEDEGCFDPLSCFMYYAQGRASGGCVLVK